MTTWLQHVEKWRGCQRCPLAQQRGRICLARACTSQDASGAYGGSVRCHVLFVGEAPGSSEDAVGMPFVGPAGDLLDQIRQRALPPNVPCAFTNLVACYPREAKAAKVNEPERSEILACRPRLVEFINLAQPRLIVRVGELAQRYLSFNSGTPLVDIVHPAYILARLPLAQKRFAVDKCTVQIRNAWEDVVNGPPTQFTPWEYDDAEGTKAKEIRRIYRDAGEHSKHLLPEESYDWETWRPKPGDDDIPF